MTATQERKRRHAPRRPKIGPLYEMLPLLANGMSYKQIGIHLGLTDDGVRSRATVLYEHLGATNQTHAVAIAYQRGLLPTSVHHPLTAGRHNPACALLTPRLCNCGATPPPRNGAA